MWSLGRAEASVICLLAGLLSAAPAELKPFGVRAVDSVTGRGIPMVELRSVSEWRGFTDSAGWLAIDDPVFEGAAVFFHVSSPGYEFPRDGLGQVGVVLHPRVGQTAEIKLARRQKAERIARLTGEGIYAESHRLGLPAPHRYPLINSLVTGQDSAQATVLGNRVYWFWGDTNRLRYPLGHFGTAGATTPFPVALHDGVPVPDFSYWTDDEGFSRPVFRLGKSGLVWMDGLCAVPDESGATRLVCHFSHRQSLAKQIGHGIATWNPTTSEFEVVRQLEPDETWRHPSGHAVKLVEGSAEYVGFGDPFVNVRVPARFEAVISPIKYEALSWINEPDGSVQPRWRPLAEPLTQAREQEQIKAGTCPPDRALLQVVDEQTRQVILLHRGSVSYNAFRQAWVMIANRHGGNSLLGEVHFLEAPTAIGPWTTASLIATHGGYSFYNPVHHSFLDQQDGRILFFEGTFTAMFSGKTDKIPRYEYNQMLYRLELSSPDKSAGQRGNP
jgi:hypothetical protein